MKSLEQGHVPNLSTILYYSERGGPLSHVSPWTMFIGLLILVVAATIIQNLLLLMGIFCISLLVYLAGKLPLRKLAAWSLFPVFFIVTISILFIFEQPGKPVFTVPGIFEITDGGIILVFTLILRGLAVVNYTLFFIMSTKYSEITYLTKKLFPWPFDIIFLLTFRFLFVVFEVIDTALIAAWARGGSLRKGLTSMSILYARIFSIGILYSFDRAERVGKAMEARGFSGRIRIYEEYDLPSLRGWLFLVICMTSLAIIYLYQGVFP